VQETTNISNKVEHEVPSSSPGAVYTQPHIPNRETQGFPGEHSRSQIVEGLEPHHNDMVNERCLKLNVKPKRKLTNSSVEP
jgi:hypothetical protein